MSLRIRRRAAGKAAVTEVEDRFARQRMLMGDEAMLRLKRAHAAVFGLGGVGSWAAEALARGGVGRLTLVDFDTVSLTNINRQILALSSTAGRYKAELAAERARDINPEIEAVPICARYTAETREDFFADYDFIIDAIDLVACKLDLIQSAREKGIPIISCMGTGNKLDPSLFRISDISETYADPLARVMRRELKKRGVEKQTVLWSPELPSDTLETDEEPPQGRRSIPGSVSWVPPAAGMQLAGWVIRSITDMP